MFTPKFKRCLVKAKPNLSVRFVVLKKADSKSY